MPDRKSPLPDRPIDVLVVGAGFAGMYAVHRYRELGLDVVAVEAGDDVGGVWYWNRYPGARCDLPSLDYSYGFSKELFAEWNWTERYATQPEILAYANHVADRFDLRSAIVFGTRVEGAEYVAATGRWRVETTRGSVDAQYLVLATGQVSVPNIPQFEGIENFAGDVYHTSTWPADGVDFTGRRVALIGTGSTGIQVLPQIVKTAESTTVFQRTPTFATPMANYRYETQEELDAHKEKALEDREKARTSRFGNAHVMNEASALSVPAEERDERFEKAWQAGSNAGILLAYSDIMSDVDANATAAEFWRGKIRSQIKDPRTAEKLVPKGYPVGAKRPSLEKGFYDSFNLDNVTLVDVREDAIVEVTADGIRTASGTHEVDAIIFATGFDTLTGAILRLELRGRDGLRIQDKWADGPKTFLGLGVHGFPNMFLVAGPGSPGLLSNVIASIEHHVDWIADLLLSSRERGKSVIEATDEAEQDWKAHSDEVAAQGIYLLADTAYTGANVEGKPRALLPYVGGVGRYRDRLSEVAAAGYEGFDLR